MMQRLRRAIVVSAVLVALCVNMRSPNASAQHSTSTPVAGSPSGLPITPKPEDCRVEPRSLAFFAQAAEDLLATPAVAASEPASSPVPDATMTDMGTPADAETVNRFIAVAAQAVACGNAGDILRLSSLFTDDLAATEVVPGFGVYIERERRARVERGEADYTTETLLDEILGQPQPESAAALAAVEDVRVLPDGRVTGIVIRSIPGIGDLTSIWVMEPDNGQFRIAAEFPLSPPTSTPQASAP